MRKAFLLFIFIYCFSIFSIAFDCDDQIAISTNITFTENKSCDCADWGLKIANGDFIIDCAGYTFSSASYCPTLLSIDQTANTIIKNCNFIFNSTVSEGISIADSIDTLYMLNNNFYCKDTPYSCFHWSNILSGNTYLYNNTFIMENASIGFYFDDAEGTTHILDFSDNNISFHDITSFYGNNGYSFNITQHNHGNYYYSDYDPIYYSINCTDNDSNGICDNPFITNDTLWTDYFPLTEFAPYEEILPLCSPNWTCSDYGICNYSNIIPCLNTTDLNNCSVAFNGSLADYDQNCTFSVPLNVFIETNMSNMTLNKSSLNFCFSCNSTISKSVLSYVYRNNILVNSYSFFTNDTKCQYIDTSSQNNEISIRCIAALNMSELDIKNYLILNDLLIPGNPIINIEDDFNDDLILYSIILAFACFVLFLSVKYQSWILMIFSGLIFFVVATLWDIGFLLRMVIGIFGAIISIFAVTNGE